MCSVPASATRASRFVCASAPISTGVEVRAELPLPGNIKVIENSKRYSRFRFYVRASPGQPPTEMSNSPGRLVFASPTADMTMKRANCLNRPGKRARPRPPGRAPSMNGKHGWSDAREMVAMRDRLKNRNPARDVPTRLSTRPPLYPCASELMRPRPPRAHSPVHRLSL